MEFKFTKSPERAKLHHDQLIMEISGYEDQIKELTNRRAEAMEELAEYKTVLAQNGHTTIPLQMPTVITGGKTTLHLPNVEEEKHNEKHPRYSKDTSMHNKIIWALGKYGPMTSSEIIEKLRKQEPEIIPKDVSSILSQAIGYKKRAIERIPVNGSKPKFGLINK